MRRLAKQDRQDKVRSNRDYQTIHERKSVAIKLDANQSSRLTFCSQIEEMGNVGFIGAGLYISTNVAADLKFTLVAPSGAEREVTFHCDDSWHRVGAAVPNGSTGEARLVMDIPAEVNEINVWGLDCGGLQLPDIVVQRNGASAEELKFNTDTRMLVPPARTSHRHGPDARWLGERIHIRKARQNDSPEEVRLLSAPTPPRSCET